MHDTRAIAAIFALTGFVVCIFAGLGGGGDAATTLARALVVLAVCFAIGLFGASAVRRAVVEHTEEYRSGNPIPPVVSAPAAGAEKID